MDNSQVPQTQPNPAVQPPVAPQPPIGGGVSYQMPQPSAPAPGNKKLALWVGIAVGAAILIGAAIVIVVGLMSVSKEDYRKTYSQMGEVSSANSDLDLKMSSIQFGLTSSTDTKFKNDVEAAQKAIEKVREENKELSGLKAVKVGEGKKRYDEFNDKLENYLTFVSGALTSISDFRDAAKTCDTAKNNMSSDAASVKSAIDECVSALKKVGDVPNDDVKTYTKAMSTEMENLSSLVSKMALITDPYGSQYEQYKSIRDQVYEVQDNLSDAATDFSSNFEKHAEEAEIKDAAASFLDFLDEKASK